MSKIRQKQLLWIYLLTSGEAVAGSLLGIFVPLYLFSKGYDAAQVLLFFLIYAVSVFVSFAVAAKLAGRFNLKTVMWLRLPFLFAYLAALYFWPAWISLPLLAVLLGVQGAFYYFPINFLFATTATATDMGRAVGRLLAWPSILTIFSPLLSGLIIWHWGFATLFLLSAVLYALATIPLFFLKILDSTPIVWSWSGFMKELNHHPKFFWMNLLENIGSETSGIIWPIFVFLMLRNIFSVSILNTAIALGGAIFTFWVGRLVDRENKTVVLKFGAVILIMIWLARYFITDEIWIYGVSLLAGFFGALFAVPFSALSFTLAKTHNVTQFLFFQEFTNFLGRVIIYSLAILVVDHLSATFLAAAAAYVGLLSW